MVDDAVGEGSQGVPALGHNMTDSQVRLWQKVAGLEPTLAWLWIENHVGPYDAQRALALGETMHDVLTKRQAARDEAEAEKRRPLFWRAFSEEEARVWFRRNFSEQDATAWRSQGFDASTADEWRTVSQFPPEQASLWLIFGFKSSEAAAWCAAEFDDPSEASDWRGFTIDPRNAGSWRREQFSIDDAREWTFLFGPQQSAATGGVITFNASTASAWSANDFTRGQAEQWILAGYSLAEALQMSDEGHPAPTFDAAELGTDPSVIIWAERNGLIRLSTLADLKSIAANIASIVEIMQCDNWGSLQAAIGDERIEALLGDELEDEWAMEQSARRRKRTARPGGSYPRTWFPDLSDQLNDAKSLTDPSCLTGLPPEILALGNYSPGSPMTDSYVDWSPTDLAHIAQVARGLGLRFSRQQELFNRTFELAYL